MNRYTDPKLPKDVAAWLFMSLVLIFFVATIGVMAHSWYVWTSLVIVTIVFCTLMAPENSEDDDA